MEINGSNTGVFKELCDKIEWKIANSKFSSLNQSGTLVLLNFILVAMGVDMLLGEILHGTTIFLTFSFWYPKLFWILHVTTIVSTNSLL